jgi:hypothetical protein
MFNTYEMGMSLDRPMLLLVLPASVNLADGDSVERAITGIDEDQIFLCGGTVRPKEAEGGDGR